MNLKELSLAVNHAIEHCRNPEEVIVGIKATHLGCVGGTPLVNVKSVFKGFDWDNNKFIICPELDLRDINKDEIAAINKALDKTGWTAYEFANLKRENARLRKELGARNVNNN